MPEPVLFVTCHLPFPGLSGGRLRELELLKRVSSDFEIHLVALSKTYEEDVANAARLAPYCSSVRVFPAQPAGSPHLATQVRRHHCDAATRHVSEVLSEVVLAHVEGFYLMQHIPRDADVPVLLVEQNVEYRLWRQRARSAKKNQERMAYLMEYLKTLKAETEAWRRATLCAAVTEEDRRIMLTTDPDLDIRVVPDGIDHLDYEVGSSAHPTATSDDVIAYVANFAYEPNVDGALWLLRDIYPRVRQRYPRARLFLVGNEPPRDVLKEASKHPAVVVTGRVDTVAPYIDAARVIACPLRVGGGIKVKVLEALSRGKALVTTSVGAQGLPGVDRAAVVVDDAASFAGALATLLSDDARRRDVEAAARKFAAMLPTWDGAADRLRSVYDEVAGARRLVSGEAPVS